MSRYVNFNCKKKIIIKSLNLNYNPNLKYKYYKFFFYLPINWNSILIKTNKKNFKNFYLFYIYSNIYFFFLPIFNKLFRFYFDFFVNVIYIKFFNINNFYKLYWFYIKNFFYSLNLIFFIKLKFKGKGYYIFKNKRNTISPKFGYSHKINIFFFFFSVKFLSKTSILLFGINKSLLIFHSLFLKNIKPINIFTNRGIRFNKEIIYKKVGKVSSYR